MQSISLDYKNALKKFGRRIRAKIWVYNYYGISTENNDTLLTENDLELSTEQINIEDFTEINGEDIYSINLINNGDILKSLMKQCNININQKLDIGRTIEIIFELLVDEENNIWELVDYGNYIIFSREYNFDTKSWSYTCYDGMFYSMKKYEPLNVSYPITVKYFINGIADRMGVPFANITDTFTNYDKLIYEDPYKNVNATYRDVLDDLSEIVGGNIWVNRFTQLEIKYPTTTYLYEHQLIDFNSLISSNTNTLTYEFKNDILTLTQQGNNAYCYQDITMLFLRNSGKVLRFDFDDIEQDESFVGDIATLNIYYQNNTVQTITLLTRDKQISTYTIPSDTSGIMFVEFAIYPNNISSSSSGTMIITKPYLHFGANKEEYIPLTNDTLDESWLKNINSYFGEKFGPVNKVTIEDKDKNINYTEILNTSIEENGETEIIIKNNPFITSENCQDIALNILNRLKDLEYYSNDVMTIGLGYYELLDLFNVKFENKIYPCLLLNSEINITTGLEENIYTKETLKSYTNYSSKNQTNDIVADTIRAKGNAYANGEKLVQESELKDSVKEKYSINEMEIGKWIDGKPIYRKVFTYSNFTLSRSVSLPNTLMPYVNEFIFTNAIAKQRNNGNVNFLSKSHPTNLDWQIGYYYNSTYGFIIEAGTEMANLTTFDIILIVEYTKI